MQFLVNGKVKELAIMDKNGTEWTNDLLGNFNALHYDDKLDAYILSQKGFEWWDLMIKRLKELDKLEKQLDEEGKSLYNEQVFPFDLLEETKEKIAWLRYYLGQ